MQGSFLPGRKAIDNVVIVQEIFNNMSKKKGIKGSMAIKFDLDKAYDRLEWSFIKRVLHHFNFPNKLISLIMHCISSVESSSG